MKLSDSEEFLPLLDHKPKYDTKKDNNYQSVLNSKKDNIIDDSSIHNYQNDIIFSKEEDEEEENGFNQSEDVTSSSDFNITYSWDKINVYGTAYVPNATTSVWKKIKNYTKNNNFLSQPEQKHILKDVYGIAYPGELLVIMGPSGAGKSTLLNALTFQSASNTSVTGFRYINGRLTCQRNDISNLSAYVEQNTLFLGNLTVKEHLIFHAMIRMDKDITYEQKLQRVEDVIAELGLEKCKNTVIGCLGKTSGISGGEMRRLSFASEILTNPLLLFCDEPTSGLDSFIALNVINVLKSMALKGKTIISTIHQPSSEMFAMFDKILLLAEGRTAFLGSPTDASQFFTELGASPLLYHNTCDIFIGLLSVIPRHEKSSLETINYVCDCFNESRYGMETLRKIYSKGKYQHVKNSNRDFLFSYNGLNSVNDNLGYKATWCTQFKALFWRSWLNLIKEPILVKVRLFQTVVLSIIVGIIYHNQKIDENGVMNINGVLFTFLTNMTFQNLFAVINVFCNELPIFTKEHGNKMYRIDTYFLSKTMAEIPIFLFIPFIFTTIVYFWIGLNPGFINYCNTVIILILVTNVATSFGYLVSCVSKNALMALSIGPPIIIPFLLFGGYLLNARAIPAYFKWFSYFSWFKYGNEALLINQWSNIDRIECTNLNSTCPKNGDIVLEMYNFEKNNFYLDLASLAVLILIFRLIAYLVLVLRMKICYKTF